MRLLLIIALLFSSHCYLFAQTQDTVLIRSDEISVVRDSVENALVEGQESRISSPTKAALLGAVMPGMGQIYNKSYWKVPIIWGGFIVMGSLIDYNHNLYQKWRNALLAEIDGDPNTINPIPFDRDRLSRNADFYRRNRDFSLIITSAYYLLTIVEAFVDAHLQDFDIVDDLALDLKPGVEPIILNQQSYGVALVISF